MIINISWHASRFFKSVKNKFENPHQKRINRSAIHFLLWHFGYYKDPPFEPLKDHFCFPNPEEESLSDKPRVTWVNHSTFWIEAFGKSILTDPIWNDRCSPFSFLGPKRLVQAKPACESIPKVDYVVISHDHYDHLDYKSIIQLHKLHPQIKWIVPLGVKRWFSRCLPSIKRSNLIELNWWESASFEQLTFTAVPAQHFSGRGLFDSNRSLWMGCVVQFIQGKQFYFAGDTGYNPIDFQQIYSNFGATDLSLLPIGVYLPRQFMKPVHVNPHESIQIHQDIRSKLSIGGHFGTFRLSSESFERPPYDLYCALQAKGVDPKDFRVLKLGQCINW